MNVILNVDKTLRLVFSLVFRLVLMLYGFVIWYCNDDNKFAPVIYLLTGIFYLIGYGILFNKKGVKSILRLTLDFALITIFLYGKTWDLTTVCYLLLPLINAPNHSGEKRSVYIYLLYVVTVVVLSYPHVKLSYLFILSILFIIERFERLRARLLRFSNSLTDMIEQFEVSPTKMQKTHEIYSSVIESINASKFKNFYSINDIICLKLSDGNLVLVNGSFFLYTVTISFSNKEIDQLKNGQPIENKECVANNKTFTKNTCIGIVIGDDLFIYIIVIGKLGWLHGMPTTSTDFLRPLFYRISKLILFDWQIRAEKVLQINRIKSKINYVNNAILAMHFLRNKFSPIKGYFETLSLVDKTTDESKKKQLLNVNQATRDRVNNSINLILQRADVILEKSENPFIISEFSPSSFRKIFDLTRKVWVDHFPQFAITYYWPTEQLESYKFLLNEEYYEILMTDIIENMKKYYIEEAKITFVVTDDTLSIVFENKINNYSNMAKELEKVVADFMDENIEEISKRTTHGLSMMKSFLKQLKINYNMQIINSKFTLELRFSKNQFL